MIASRLINLGTDPHQIGRQPVSGVSPSGQGSSGSSEPKVDRQPNAASATKAKPKSVPPYDRDVLKDVSYLQKFKQLSGQDRNRGDGLKYSRLMSICTGVLARLQKKGIVDGVISNICEMFEEFPTALKLVGTDTYKNIWESTGDVKSEDLMSIRTSKGDTVVDQSEISDERLYHLLKKFEGCYINPDAQARKRPRDGDWESTRGDSDMDLVTSDVADQVPEAAEAAGSALAVMPTPAQVEDSTYADVVSESQEKPWKKKSKKGRSGKKPRK
jgi:hypothetical protein